jgi:hypothetical protein
VVDDSAEHGLGPQNAWVGRRSLAGAGQNPGALNTTLTGMLRRFILPDFSTAGVTLLTTGLILDISDQLTTGRPNVISPGGADGYRKTGMLKYLAKIADH